MIDQDARLHVTVQVVTLNVTQGLFNNLQLNINLGNLENSSAYEQYLSRSKPGRKMKLPEQCNNIQML